MIFICVSCGKEVTSQAEIPGICYCNKLGRDVYYPKDYFLKLVDWYYHNYGYSKQQAENAARKNLESRKQVLV